MPRRFLKRYIPDSKTLRGYKSLRPLGARLHDPNLWHLNRRSVAGGLGLGVFVAFIPVPMQMLIAAFLSILLRVNLPLAVLSVWITNPLTMPVIFFAGYKFGNGLYYLFNLNEWLQADETGYWLVKQLGTFGGPLVLGSLVLGTLLGLLTYGLIRLLWRWHLVSSLRERRQRKRARAEALARSVNVQAHSTKSAHPNEKSEGYKYNNLAIEARLNVYHAIKSGDVPVDHRVITTRHPSALRGCDHE